MNKKDLKCPECKQEQFVKYGKYKNTQRYKCKLCNTTFKEKNYKITNKKEKELAVALLNLIKIKTADISCDDFKDLDLSTLIPTHIDEKEFKDVSVKLKSAKKGESSIKCNSPKIIICLINNEIEIIRLPDYITTAEHKMNRGMTTLIKKDAYYKPDKEIRLEDTRDFDKL